MAAVAGTSGSSGYSRVDVDTSRQREPRIPRFGMEKGQRINPGQIYFQGKYYDQEAFFKVS